MTEEEFESAGTNRKEAADIGNALKMLPADIPEGAVLKDIVSILSYSVKTIEANTFEYGDTAASLYTTLRNGLIARKTSLDNAFESL